MMRRAMGKKKREEMDLHAEKFVNGAVQRGIAKDKAEKVFDLMKQFADYGFNRSHSVAYAYLAFQTAYLKAHYAPYFYASVLSNESQDTAKIYKYSSELRNSGLKFLPPDVNESDIGFTPLENSVRFGLSAIKGIGTSSVEAIVEARKQGRFTSLFDFVSRIEHGSLNRRGLESLISAGAFDSLAGNGIAMNSWRSSLHAATELALSHAQKIWNDKIRGQNALFGEMEETAENVSLPNVPAWSQLKLAQEEKSAVGFYLSNHPLDEHSEVLESLGISNLAEQSEIMPGDKITIAGIVSAFQARYSKKGNRFCIFKLEDKSSGAKILGWAEAYSRYSGLLKDDELLVVSGKVESTDGQEMTIVLEEVHRLEDVVPMRAKSLVLTIPETRTDEQFLEEVFAMLSKNQGKCDVILKLELNSGATVRILSQPLRIQGSKQLETDLGARGCGVRWGLEQI
jgi:DNA polymerase-3 subunit alpha